MTQQRESQHDSESGMLDMGHQPVPSALYGHEVVGSFAPPEDFEDILALHERFLGPWGHHGVGSVRKIIPEPRQVIEQIESKLEQFETVLQSAVDIGLENRTLLEQLSEGGNNSGLGAIHSLGEGEIQLKYPLIYSYQEIDDQVVVGIEEFGVYGLGSTEDQAVKDVQEELWHLVQDLERTSCDQLGPNLKATLKAIQARIHRDAVDA